MRSPREAARTPAAEEAGTPSPPTNIVPYGCIYIYIYIYTYICVYIYIYVLCMYVYMYI